MKVLVTGPDGLLGSNLVRELLSRAYEVTGFCEAGKASPTIEGLRMKKIYGNLLNEADLLDAAFGMDVVIHCAANTSMFPARQTVVNRVNIEGTANVVKACQKNKVKRMIYVGTANSFASGNLQKLGSECNHYEAGRYGLDYMDSKYQAQQNVLKKVQDEDFDAVIVNPTFMIGPYDSRPTSGAMILGVYGKKIPGYTVGGKNFVAAKDAAVAIVNAITKGKKGECYILGNENLTFKEAFDKIAKITGVSPLKLKIPKTVCTLYGQFNSRVATILKIQPKVTKELAILSNEMHYYSAEKARKELEMPQTPIDTAIKECYDWFIENKYIKTA
ncbi:MAG: NAD-dependent epimerase/dehydratase family protein [Crocinitomicaceae bacterium]